MKYVINPQHGPQWDTAEVDRQRPSTSPSGDVKGVCQTGARELDVGAIPLRKVEIPYHDGGLPRLRELQYLPNMSLRFRALVIAVLVRSRGPRVPAHQRHLPAFDLNLCPEVRTIRK